MTQSIKAAILSVFVVTGLSVQARNGYISTKWNEIKDSHLCERIEKQELPPNLRCQNQSAAKGIVDFLVANRRATLNYVEAQAFAEAVPDWSSDSTCLINRLDVLSEQERYLEKYIAEAVPAWIGMKRAELLLETCSQLFHGYRQGYPNAVYRGGNDRNAKLEKRIEILSNPSMKRKWSKLCSNKKKMSALSTATVVFSQSLPTIGAPEVLQVIEKNRVAIVNAKTNQPLSDEEILNLNFQDEFPLHGLTYDPDFETKKDTFIKQAEPTSMKEDLQKLLKDLSRQRTELKDRMDRTPDWTKLSKQQRTMLFDQGYLIKVLERWEMIDPIGQPTRVAGCLISRYKPTIGGEIASFAATVGVGGLGLYKLFKAKKNLKRMKAFMVMGGLGLSVADWQMIADTVGSSCLEKTQLFPNSTGMSVDFAIGQEERFLQDETGLFMSANVVPLSETPSCQEKNTQDFAMQSLGRSSCFREIINAIRPI